MPLSPHPRQPQNDPVVVSAWQPDEEFPFGPQGAKPKRQLVCPEMAPKGYLYDGHVYLFKEPTGSRAQQIWSEVIAYEFGKLVGVQVPPAFLAIDEERGVPGVLVEFFYGYSEEKPARRFIQGVDRLQAGGFKLDVSHGGLRDNISVCRQHKVVNWREWWGQSLAFDAVIGNTDRHAANWGFLVDQSTGGDPRYSMAPAFDNGTSLGFIVRDEDLARQMEPARFQRFVDGGRHSYSWMAGEPKGAQFADLCSQFVSVYGSAGPAVHDVIHLSDSEIDDVLQWCTRFDFPVRFLPERADFVSALTKARRDAVARAIGA